MTNCKPCKGKNTFSRKGAAHCTACRPGTFANKQKDKCSKLNLNLKIQDSPSHLSVKPMLYAKNTKFI